MQDVIETITKQLLASPSIMDRVRGVARRGALHKTAQSVLPHHLSGEVTIHSALRGLGQKLYVKKAEWRMVHAGLTALAELEEGM